MPASVSGQSFWPATCSEPLLECTLPELLRDVAAQCPEATALVDAGEASMVWNYRDLLDEVTGRAGALVERFQPGERIGIYAPNSADWIIIQHAVAMAGLVLVPINPAYGAKELGQIVQSAGLSAIFYSDNYRGQSLREHIDAAVKEYPLLRECWSMDVWREGLSKPQTIPDFPPIDPGDTMLIQFTSGTTGAPKGACLHHRGTINMARFVGQRADFPEGGSWINAMPLYHVGGAVVTALATLNGRGKYVVAPGFDPGHLLSLIESEKGNCTLVVPTMIHALLAHPDFEQADLSSLTTVLTGAAPVPETLGREVRDRFKSNLSILFGQTELNGVISQTTVDDDLVDQCGTLGRPLPHVEVRIVDPDTLEDTALGEPGEIWARGYQVMNGYHNMAEATAQTITPDGWLRMGDIATMDDRGFLRIVGRLKDLIIRGGMNIYPREIEDVLEEHPAVAQVSVVGIPDDHWGEIVAAVIMLRDPAGPPDPGELHRHCRDRLAAHKAPERWYFVQEFPLTPSGKIQKFELIDRIASGLLAAEPWERGKANATERAEATD